MSIHHYIMDVTYYMDDFWGSKHCFRLFSVLAIAILGVLGYTHIRKDFGEKIGMLFSFLVYFLPVICIYSQEIRMYSLAYLLVTIMAIYAYRFYKSVKDKNAMENQNKNLIIFAIFSILSCYTHYYALATAGLINLILFIFLIKNVLKARKQKDLDVKDKKEISKPLKKFLIAAIVQVILYIPWLLFLIEQMTRVGGGFWIQLNLNTLIEVPSFQFRVQTDSTINATAIISLIVSIVLYIYMGYRIYKAKKIKEKILPAVISIIIYITVIVAVLIISLIGSPILVGRYLLTLTGLYIFVFAFFMAKEERKWVTGIICAVILILSFIGNYNSIKNNYDTSNKEVMNFMEENIQKDDIIIYNEIGVGGVLASYFPDNKQYFYNQWYWDVEEAYKAYAPAMETVYSYDEILDNYQGRVWVVGTVGSNIYKDVPKDNMNTIIEAKEYKIAYQNCSYQFTLFEKK